MRRFAVLWWVLAGCAPGEAKLDSDPTETDGLPSDGAIDGDADTDADADADVDADADTDTVEPTDTGDTTTTDTDTVVPTDTGTDPTTDTGTIPTTEPAVDPYDGTYAGVFDMDCSDLLGIVTANCSGELELTATAGVLEGTGDCTFDGLLALLGPQGIDLGGEFLAPDPGASGEVRVSLLDTEWEGTFADLDPDVYTRLAGAFEGEMTLLEITPVALFCDGTFDARRP